jgi:nickel transport protein
MNRFFYSTGLILLGCCFFAADCFAHKISIFAYVDQGLVKTESKFSGGRPAKGCQLSMVKGSSTVVIGRTDESGFFNFPVPEQKQAFDLVVTCGDGHRGQWRVEADELPGTGIPVKDVDSPLKATQVQVNTVEKDQDIRRLLREELGAELGPIKRQLAELKQDRVSVTDIMGGLGYFLGLAGLASYMRFRKEGK